MGVVTTASGDHNHRTNGVRPDLAAVRGNGHAVEAGPTAEDVERFLGLLAHELGSPLTVVAAAAETVVHLLEQDDVDRDQVQRVAEILRRNGRLAAQLLDQLRFAFLVGQGPSDVVPQRLDLTELVREVVEDVGTFLLPARVITVSSPGPVRVRVDPTTVSAILCNLLTNADRYSSAIASIEVRTERDRDTARVVVRDHGRGVEPHHAETIFDPYVQGDADRGGLGLGLYVSRQLARAQGGDVTVRAAEPVGSDFVLHLPVAVT